MSIDDGVLQTTFADTINARLAEIKDQLQRRERGEAVYPCLPTGLRTWDSNGGILRGILTVLGAGTGEGKSIVKLQLARGAAQAGFKVLMVDFEDPAAKTADRDFSAVTGINSRLLGLLEIDDLDLAQLEAAARQTETWAARVEHHVGLMDVERTLALMANSGADLMLIDYAQAFPEDHDKTMERTIANFAWKANELAQKKNVAIVVFSQIVREVEQRGYRIFERARQRDPDAMDVSGFCPTGLSDVAWAKTLGERAKELGYIWRENRIAKKLGANVRDDKLRIIMAKVNFGDEKDMLFHFDGATATIKERK